MKKFAASVTILLLALFAFAQTAPTVEETIAALEGGITNIPLDAAIQNIEGWEEQLGASEDVALQSIADQLGELREALSEETIDGLQVGGLLTSLGAETAAAGQDAGDEQLTQLGTLLSEAGAMLTGDDMAGDAATGGVTGTDTMTGGEMGAMTGGEMDMGVMTGGEMGMDDAMTGGEMDDMDDDSDDQ